VKPTEEPAAQTSRALHWVGEFASGERIAASVAAVVVGWLAIYVIRGFPTWMASALEMAAASVTLVMVFVIQHTQRRRQDATQLKLDELVRSLSGADDAIAGIEANDEELERRRQPAR
jgi:low affinity Fe/Cu permease